jgi:disulfide bond formation protein DsbB
VEWKWWPGPASCTGGGAVNAGQLAAFMNGAKLNVPQCDQAAGRLLGLSMAGYNALISLGLTVLSALAVREARDHG